LGEVLAIGEGRRLEENGTRFKPTVIVGDTVLVPALAANFAEHFNRRTAIYRERDIYAVVDDPENIFIPRDPAYE
jgi:co-chaperonin GroES (HSP10)